MERQGPAAWAKAGGWDQVVQDACQGDVQLVWAELELRRSGSSLGPSQ